jgi:hypothetical protein
MRQATTTEKIGTILRAKGDYTKVKITSITELDMRAAMGNRPDAFLPCYKGTYTDFNEKKGQVRTTYVLFSEISKWDVVEA